MTVPIRFEARALEKVGHSPGEPVHPTWYSIRVGVFDLSGTNERQIGEYVRNYPTLFRTFHHFRLGDRDYALYSRHYTATRLMELPSCRDLGGEEPSDSGFCPIDYFVPCRDESIEEQRLYLGSGFVAGCVWGDDSTYKIQYLDLTRAAKGMIVRDARFGYIHLPEKLTLEQAISTHFYDRGQPIQSIAIATQQEFEISTGRNVTFDPP